MINRINVYTKVCLPCVDKKLWTKFEKAVWSAGYDIRTIRTTYDKGLHKEATELWGSDNYVAFALLPNGEVKNIKESIKMFEEIKDKLVKAGKTKPVRKGKKNVQGLRKTKPTKKPIRVSYVEDSPNEIKVQDKTR